MIREIVEARNFSKAKESFFKKRQLLPSDFDDFKNDLAENPEAGDVIVGTGGIRKIRLKSATKGKSGGFRICYYVLLEKERIYLLFIYPKNAQENLTMAEKKELKGLVETLKGERNE